MDLTPIWLTLKLASITTLILLLIGLPLAYWLSKGRSIAKIVLEAIITMPLVLPPSVLGFYLLLAFSPQHGAGKWLQQVFDVRLVFSFQGLILASVIYSMPFMIGPIKSALQQLPVSLSQASYTLGKTERQTFIHVLLPNIRASVLTAAILTFAHTLGEFGVVLMIGGNIPGVTRVASIAVYDSVENQDYASANHYSLILFSITFVMVISVFVFNKYKAKNSPGMISIDIEKKLKAYKGQQVLKIAAQFPAGSITKIYGPSGSGKTTFLKIIAGLTDPEKGKITVDDTVWLDTSAKLSLSPQKRKPGFVFQNYALFPNMTVQQHLEYATDDQQWIKRLLAIGKLETFLEHKPEHLSGGQQQRLAILRAMATKPKLLLMDEPFSALDPKMKSEIIIELKSLWKELGTTVLIVSHNPQELEGLTELEISFT